MKLIKKILSVFLCLTVIIGSLSVGSFSVSAASVKGNRGADGKGFIYKKTAEYTYTDANGKKHSQHYEGWENFKVHFFAPSGKTLNFLDYTQRAYCIEPDKASELTGSATVKSTSQSAAWKQLTTAQQNAVNLILAWGFGGFEAAKKEKVHYYYATQLLIFEIVAGKRNASTFEAVTGKPLLTPANTMTETSSAETTLANVTTAYNNMVSWCKRSVRNPSYTASSLSSAKSYQMSYNQSNGQYSITLTDKNGTASVTKASDVIVSNSNVKVSVSGKKITFTCSKNLGTTVNVTMKNSFLKEHGIKSKNSLYLITSNDYASYQTFAQGSNYTVKDGYVKLTFPDVVKLQLHKSSSNKELTAGNGCYSLSGAEYGIYTDKACTKKIGSITTNASGYGSYNKYVDSTASYYAKETKAPKGYELDKTVYTFVTSGKKDSNGYAIFKAVSLSDKKTEPQDNPVNDPVGIVLQKKNAITGETTNQGLGGAVFSIEYYAQEIDKDYDVKADETAPALDSKNLKKTWYIETNSNGYCDLNKKFLAEGYNSDDFYFWENNPEPIVPIGTVVIREVKAPDGYSLSNVVFYRHISEEIAEIAKDTNTPINVPIDEMPATGSININKTSEDGVIEGLSFKLESFDDEREFGDDLIPTPMAYDAAGNEITSIVLTTDKNGKASTDNEQFYDVNGNTIDGILPYVFNQNGFQITYRLTEIGIKQSDGTYKFPSRYELKDAVEFTIYDTDEYTYTYDCVNTVKTGSLQVQKTSEDDVVDGLYFEISCAETGFNEKVSTDLEGLSPEISDLPIYNSNDELLKYKVTELGELNEDGTYSLPYKYNKPKSVTVTLNSDTVVFANIKNTLKTGSVKLTKTDGTKALGGSGWKLYKSDDTPISCYQTGSGTYMYNSVAKTATDYMATNGSLSISNLPVGDYYFIESVTPSGYMPYGKKVEFTISADNENTLNISLTVADNKSVLSQTGGGGIAPFYFASVALGALAIFFIYDYRKHGSKKYKKSRKENQK